MWGGTAVCPQLWALRTLCYERWGEEEEDGAHGTGSERMRDRHTIPTECGLETVVRPAKRTQGGRKGQQERI